MQENKLKLNPLNEKVWTNLPGTVPAAFCELHLQRPGFWCSPRNFIFINYLNLPTQPDLIDLPFLHAYKLFAADSKFRQSDQMNSDTVLLITLSAAFKRLKRWEKLMRCDWLLGRFRDFDIMLESNKDFWAAAAEPHKSDTLLCLQHTLSSMDMTQPCFSTLRLFEDKCFFWLTAVYSAPPDMRHTDLKHLLLSLCFF